MFTVRDSILIQAPIERCFQLSTSLALVQKELKMHPTAGGRMTGHVTGGDTVRWKGWQLGFPNYHVSLIPPETFSPPTYFQDRMIAGRFHAFEHDHHFEVTPEGTLLRDEVRYTMPFGAAGALVGRVVLQPHIRGLVHRRFQMLKRLSETEEWRQYLPA